MQTQKPLYKHGPVVIGTRFNVKLILDTKMQNGAF